MRELMLSLTAGIVAGVLFSVLKFPIPAPVSIGGFMGILGVYMGALLNRKLKTKRKGEMV